MAGIEESAIAQARRAAASIMEQALALSAHAKLNPVVESMEAMMMMSAEALMATTLAASPVGGRPLTENLDFAAKAKQAADVIMKQAAGIEKAGGRDADFSRAMMMMSAEGMIAMAAALR